MKKLLLITLTIGLVLSCTGENPVDPTVLNGPFYGYVKTDETGNFLGGSGDDNEWVLYYGSSQYVADINTISSENQTVSTAHSKIIPDHFHIYPAYPNPTNDIFTLRFSFAVSSDVIITIVDKNFKIIYQECLSFEAGSHNWAISLVDSFDYFYEFNMYRVYIDINKEITGYGDVLYYELIDVTDIY